LMTRRCPSFGSARQVVPLLAGERAAEQPAGWRGQPLHPLCSAERQQRAGRPRSPCSVGRWWPAVVVDDRVSGGSCRPLLKATRVSLPCAIFKVGEVEHDRLVPGPRMPMQERVRAEVSKVALRR
jgi:hypothetical protein